MSAPIITVGAIAGLCICGRSPCEGLDCGPFLPGQAPRRRPPAKSPAEHAVIKARAWATRRARYGQCGHAGSYRR